MLFVQRYFLDGFEIFPLFLMHQIRIVLFRLVCGEGVILNTSCLGGLGRNLRVRSQDLFVVIVCGLC